ncbi:MAG: TraB/GumN family protein, partial [Bacteroidota bacterium]
PPIGIDRMHPTMLAMTFVLVYTEEAVHLPKPGVEPMDVYFLEEGRRRGKTISTFESIEDQMEFLFNYAPMPEVVEHLVLIVKEKEEVKNLQPEMLEAYEKGDLDALLKGTEKYMGKYGSMDVLLDQRNANWMKILPDMMKKESQFVAVGALHLASEVGLVHQLRELGYTVEQVDK